MKRMYVYIITNKRNGTLYSGVTSDLVKRIWQHKNKTYGGFSARHNLDMLVYYEIYEDQITAISREKRLKKYKREWKINLIEKDNSERVDLWDSIV